MRVAGTFIWTVCAAGWTVIALTLDHTPAMFVALGCILIGALWNEVMPD